MKKITIMLTITLIISCAGQDKKPEYKNNSNNYADTETGWTDQDTYTVSVIAENVEKALDKAKHQILKNIVDVRMRNQSKYTNITKISDEFEKPIKNGRIISRKKLTDGIKIYFRIKDKGLRKKFERK